MSEYKVSQAVMDELNVLREQKDKWSIYGLFDGLPGNLEKWINRHQEFSYSKVQKKELAVIDYAFNGADNFEVKTPTWVIVSKKVDYDGWRHYFIKLQRFGITAWTRFNASNKKLAIKDATRIADPKLKDALLYANKDFEAIEVEE